MFKRRDKIPARIDTLIGKSVRVQGNVQFRGGLHIDGSIGGNVFADPDTAAMLSVSEHGQIDGSIDAPQVVLNGRVNGDIVASERLVLGAKARVLGNVHYGAIELALGAEVNGRLVSRSAAAAGDTVVSPLNGH